MNPVISVISGKATVTGKLSPKWKFDFTTGYGAWALTCGLHGKNKQIQTIPWEVILRIKINESTPAFLHKQVGACSSLDIEHYKFTPDQRNKRGLVVWTKTQWLYILTNEGSEILQSITWEPYTFLCSWFALRESEYYSGEQINYLESFFDPEWAGKGGIVDDQAFFDLWIPGQITVYHGFWKIFMTRLREYLIREGCLSISNPSITDKTKLTIKGEVSPEVSTEMQRRLYSFFSSELQIGIFRKMSKNEVDGFHKKLPDRLREWIERRA